MRKLIVAAALTFPFMAAFGAGTASADPQMLGVIETASAVPLHCKGGKCGAELTSICLHEERATPTHGYRYTAHSTEKLA